MLYVARGLRDDSELTLAKEFVDEVPVIAPVVGEVEVMCRAKRMVEPQARTGSRDPRVDAPSMRLEGLLDELDCVSCCRREFVHMEAFGIAAHGSSGTGIVIGTGQRPGDFGFGFGFAFAPPGRSFFWGSAHFSTDSESANATAIGEFGLPG